MALVVKNPPANTGDVRDTSSVPGLGRSPGEGNSNPPQYSLTTYAVSPAASPWGIHPE